MIASRIDLLKYNEFEFFLKRDDLLGKINGNKARKLAFLETNKHQFKKGQVFISYGSSQSNALAALAIFCHENDFKLIFICEKISSFLKENPHGNYLTALKCGVKIIENEEFANRKSKALSLKKPDDIFIEEGIAIKEAEIGYKNLALELQKQLNEKVDIFLPSGTGTSAAFLAKHSKFKVFTCACVGDSAYLREQILALEPNYDFSNLTILNPPKKYHFAKPYLEFYELYKDLKSQCKVEFDLLYDMVGFKTLLANKEIFENKILYIHQGGLDGNVSMLRRYKYKFD
ncbi:1-aminocyclopropane-1-carboxylate deaminase/D-cysteine desulfhydrase [Campylobacter volucris]|uniref:1-aminocyclopropane-1-carboxylate deaminase/D-cysteine desulfhydrase n=1 Tax=Campylobacter volucris TaxID=1031542 RepID=A0AAE6CZX7_9BACT|nr:pyridoxal-phosphate dependent enzyme [Campylobacter volucris]KAB0580346.1 1-aminocyclopropane-1-carboxylate deaminase/D-cysteine desulfhydrase [Campylobacter volucris]QBL14243.1 1-aminocyclopropane-1-carboxylate deaminase/D-cysteine desulfhydrase [Campylobacter volucris]QEL08406.1 1-aminocyclopropane-1-carboxylate deaminase [Campylobacter volucris]TXK70575.1 1-aminocyclopropane-1-carboxylate deaminase/D-cysteine desulfhydrase [Campylobacter volucris]